MSYHSSSRTFALAGARSTPDHRRLLASADHVELVMAKPSRMKKQITKIDVRNAKCRVSRDLDEYIHLRVVELGDGDLTKGFQARQLHSEEIYSICSRTSIYAGVGTMKSEG